MKKLGLIGGVGPASTIAYYRGIVYGIQQQLDKPYFPPLVIESLSSFEVLRMSAQGDEAGLTEYLLTGIKNLAAAGAEVAALTCNTGHMVFDALQRRSPIPLISIVQTACAQAQRQHWKTVGLLGTSATMEGNFFRAPFIQAGIDVRIPECTDRAYIADCIVRELEKGIIREQTAQRLIEIAEHMTKQYHLDAVILGCTELPLLFEGRHISVPILDTMQLHIQQLIHVMMEESN